MILKIQLDKLYIFLERSELAGYVNEGGGLTFVLVRNAGHMVPISQPLRAWDLVTRYQTTSYLFLNLNVRYRKNFCYPDLLITPKIKIVG